MQAILVQHPSLTRTLRHASRVVGVVCLAFVLVAFFDEGGIPAGVAAGHGIAPVLCLAAGCAGLAAGLKWRAAGGILALASLGAFHAVHRGGTGAPWPLLLFGLPGLLYLAAWASGQVAREGDARPRPR